MKLRILLLSTMILVLVGCGQIAKAQFSSAAPHALGVASAERPSIDLPAPWRCQNWGKEGSCVYASTIMALHKAGYHAEARKFRASYSGGCAAERLERCLRSAGVPFRSISNGDPQFLARAMAAGRPCVIWWEGASHCVLLVHLDSQRAAICDPNCAHHQHWLSRAEFFREWHHRDCRYALTVLNSPPPFPRPIRRPPDHAIPPFLILRSPIVLRSPFAVQF